MAQPIIFWERIGDLHPDMKGEPDQFVAMDGKAEVGVVRFVGSGVDAGSWAWSMLLTHPGPAFNRPTSGIVPTARDAAHELLDCYTAFRKWFGIAEGEGGP